MDQGITQYVKKRYRKQVLERMLLCMDQKQQYNIMRLSAIHISAHVWVNTPAEVVKMNKQSIFFSMLKNTTAAKKYS